MGTGRRRQSIIALAVLVTSVRAAPATVDLSGNWIETWGGQSVPVRIAQTGASLRYGYADGTINVQSGAFRVVFYHAPGCPGPYVLRGQLIDANRFVGEISGWVPAFQPSCRPLTPATVVGERVQPLPSPTPSPSRLPTSTASPSATTAASPTRTASAFPSTTPAASPSPTAPASPTPTPSESPVPTSSPSPTATAVRCTGDCDGNGQVTVDEVTRLIGCPIGLHVDRFCPVLACGDPNGSGAIEVNELVIAVNNLLRGCP